MNTYRTVFFAVCPKDGALIRYEWEIRTTQMIPAEDIEARANELSSGFHETFADALHQRFGGTQILRATHGRVAIETVRPWPGSAA